MNLLLDTHAMLWFVSGDSMMSKRSRDAIENPETVNYVSMASWWEIAIKCSLNKLVIGDTVEDFMTKRIDEGFRVLPVELAHLHPLATLPFHHRDPFDRLIICQATKEHMPICTGDANFSSYDIEVIW